MPDGIVRGYSMVSLFFALLAISILRSYPEARKLKIGEFQRRSLLRLIVFSGCVAFWVTIYHSVNSSIEDIQDGKTLIGFIGLLLMIVCIPIVFYMQAISIFAKFSFFDSQMKWMYRIDR